MVASLDIDEVRGLLLKRKGEWPQVAQDNDISYSWLVKFAGGSIGNPSYARLKKLFTYLSAAPAASEA